MWPVRSKGFNIADLIDPDCVSGFGSPSPPTIERGLEKPTNPFILCHQEQASAIITPSDRLRTHVPRTLPVVRLEKLNRSGGL